jgi:polyhydroxybutyrate depolymerase
MFKKNSKMIYLIPGVLAICIIGLFVYTYRWNILNPNKSGSLLVDNIERTFVYHVPKKLHKNPKLIIAYHGSKMKAFMMQIFTGHEFDELADLDENTIIVYPQGYKNNWNDCRKQAPFPAKQLNIDDVTFTRQIISFFEKEYHTDPVNIFAVGFSNGGQMVMKLARETPALFRGFAVISANLPTETNDGCLDMEQPVSLLLMNGTNDPINPDEGGEVILDGQSFGSVMSTGQNLDHWLRVSNCDTTAKRVTRFPPNGEGVTVVQKTFLSPTSQKTVSIVKVVGGGHIIPNPNFRIPIKKMGHLNTDVNGPRLIWDFFMGLK